MPNDDDWFDEDVADPVWSKHKGTESKAYGVFHLSKSTKMHTTRVVMGRGSVSTHHGQKRILKHTTPDLVTYIQKVQ